MNDEISSLSGSGLSNAGNIELSDNLLPPIKREDLKPGLNVYVNTLGTDAIVVSNISKDDTVQVQVGIMKMKVDIKNLYQASPVDILQVLLTEKLELEALTKCFG